MSCTTQKIFIISVALLSWALSFGQYQRLDRVSHNVSAQIDLVNGQLDLTTEENLSSSMIREISISLTNGEIIVEYEFQRANQGQNYRVDFNANLNGSDLVLYREDIIGAIGQDLAANQQGRRQLIWTGLHDRYVDLNGILLMSLDVELWGQPQLPFGIECGVPPTFTMKQKMPYLIAAGVGAASLGASLLFKNKSNDTYENDYLTQNFQEAAEPFYQQANDDHQKSLIFRYAGIGILAIDAGLYIFRSIRHQRKKDAYDEYCRNVSGIRFEPVVEPSLSAVNPGQLGLKLTWTFGQ